MTLKYLDTTIAFVVVMLLLSMLVMVLVQASTSILKLRGRNLVAGLEMLLKQAWPELGKKADPNDAKSWTMAGEIAVQVAKHPAIAAWRLGGTEYAQAISKTELLAILSAIKGDAAANLSNAAKTQLATLLDAHLPGSADIAQKIGIELAQRFPAQADQLRDVAVAAVGRVSKAEADVEQWFDTVMTRTTDWYKAKTRVITVLVSFALAFVLQVDTLAIFHQLSTDPELRAQLVQSSDAVQKKYEASQKLQQQAAATASTDQAQAAKDAQAALKDLNDTIKQAKGTFEQAQLNLLPNNYPSGFWSWYASGTHFLGTLLTALFLSLGAPFWFNTLRELSSLRPNVAAKVEPDGGDGKDDKKKKKT